MALHLLLQQMLQGLSHQGMRYRLGNVYVSHRPYQQYLAATSGSTMNE